MTAMTATTKSLAVLAAAALLLGACAPKKWDSAQDGPFDPLQDINRKTYAFNKGVDFILLEPAGIAYQNLPPPVARGIGNILDNLSEPVYIANNALQKEGDAAVNSTARLAINTVFGLGGVFDLATALDIPRRESDFGLTMRGYGMPETAYLVLPLFGPSTVTDALGGGVDFHFAPQTYIESNTAFYALHGTAAARIRAERADEIELIEQISLDEYLFVRDAYASKRQHDTPAGLRLRRE